MNFSTHQQQSPSYTATPLNGEYVKGIFPKSNVKKSLTESMIITHWICHRCDHDIHLTYTQCTKYKRCRKLRRMYVDLIYLGFRYFVLGYIFFFFFDGGIKTQFSRQIRGFRFFFLFGFGYRWKFNHLLWFRSIFSPPAIYSFIIYPYKYQDVSTYFSFSFSLLTFTRQNRQ